jgi:hypothetical protein
VHDVGMTVTRDYQQSISISNIASHLIISYDSSKYLHNDVLLIFISNS